MKKLTCVILIVLGTIAFAFLPNSTIAAGESGTVTGAASCTFAPGAAFNSVALSSLDLGTGVFIEPDGSATGPFNAVLSGYSLLGQPRQVTVDGKVLSGAIAPDGRAYVSGIATVNFRNGTPPLVGVPFGVTTTADSLVLSINSTTLPAAQLNAGAISIE
jgi:hypothetical protein